MNLQVNLIRPGEMRSASAVSLKALLQITAMVIPLGLVLYGINLYLKATELRTEYELVQGQWEESEARKKQAEQLRQKSSDATRTLKDVRGWEAARPDWNTFLDPFQRAVPASIQLMTLQVRHRMEISPQNQPVRVWSAVVGGRCQGPGAEERVDRLRRDLLNRPGFTHWVRQAEVTLFREDDIAGAGPEDRIFQIKIDFIPLPLHETS